MCWIIACNVFIVVYYTILKPCRKRKVESDERMHVDVGFNFDDQVTQLLGKS